LHLAVAVVGFGLLLVLVIVVLFNVWVCTSGIIYFWRLWLPSGVVCLVVWCVWLSGGFVSLVALWCGFWLFFKMGICWFATASNDGKSESEQKSIIFENHDFLAVWFRVVQKILVFKNYDFLVWEMGEKRG
jgi:hypothetical protein